MRQGRGTAIAFGLLIVAAAGIGWRGSRPVSPIATTRSDGVTVVPATGTLSSTDAQPSASGVAPAPTTPAAPAPLPPETGRDAGSMLRDLDAVVAAFDREPRDPAWSPGTKAGLRTAFARIPGLDTPTAAECRVSLCRVTAHTAATAPREEADRAVSALQARISAQTRSSAPFTANHFNLEQIEESGEANFTAYLLRR